MNFKKKFKTNKNKSTNTKDIIKNSSKSEKKLSGTTIIYNKEKKDKENVVSEHKINIVKKDIKSLSKIELRAFARSGVLPNVKNNIYTRFNDETPKI